MTHVFLRPGCLAYCSLLTGSANGQGRSSHAPGLYGRQMHPRDLLIGGLGDMALECLGRGTEPAVKLRYKTVEQINRCRALLIALLDPVIPKPFEQADTVPEGFGVAQPRGAHCQHVVILQDRR